MIKQCLIFAIALVAVYLPAMDHSPADEILVIGNNAVDRVFYVNGPVGKTGKRVATDMKIFCGGQAANVAYTLAPLTTSKVTYLGIFGNDCDAQMNRQSLETVGVSIDALTLKCPSNTASICVNTDSGEREITFYPSIALHLKANSCYQEFLKSQQIKDLRSLQLIYSDCRMPELSEVIFKAAMGHSIPIVLDLELLTDENRKLLDYATILITNSCVISDLAQESNIEEALRIVAEKYDLLGAVATLGDGGFISIEKMEETNSYCLRTQAGLAIQAKETTGAGDAFHAAFIAAWVRKKSYFESLCFANLVAAEKCKVFGPRLEVTQLRELVKGL